MHKLTDSSGRHIHKLRLNLLDACNMRCIYCMPEDAQFLSRKHLLSSTKIAHIISNLMEFGIDEVRITGGEPLLRPDLYDIIKKISALRLKKIGITTNGIGLKRHLEFFSKHKVENINISLDSLCETTFTFMTKRNVLNEVIDGILLAKELGFNVKVNSVIMRNYNFSEIPDFLDFSKRHEIEVRFLEMMKIGQAQKHFESEFVPAAEMLKLIEAHGYILNPLEVPVDSTAFNYSFEETGKIGFIASESKPFCGGCSRLRLSADGTLRPCIMIDAGPNLSNLDFSEYDKVLAHLIEQKPTDRIEKIDRTMNEIGG